jgi:glycosyltransferase involved in cell wall biosynthesis
VTVALSYWDMDAEGYGRMGREIHFAMERLGVSVTANPLDRTADTVLFCKIPPQAKQWLRGQRVNILTMFETTVWPLQFRDMHVFETVFVPCEANRVAAAEWHPDVRVVPLAVDDRWRYRKPKVNGRFRIMSSGSQLRKGLDLASDAFIKAFGNNDDVELVLKTPHGSQAKIPNHSRISRVNGVLPAADEVALYESANIYLGLSRGEGFGMMPLQSIVQGTPTIMSAGHGHDMFAKYATTVDTSLVPAVSYDMYGVCGDWWESDVDDAVDKLRWVYDNYDNSVAQSAKHAKKAKKEFTWENTAQGLLNGIGEHGSYHGSGEVMRPVLREVAIEVTREITADIGPYRIEYAPGVRYWAPPSVKQSLRDGGYISDEVWNTTVWRDDVERVP